MTDKYILTIDGGKENAFTKEYTREELEAKKDYIAQTYAGRYRVDAIGAADTSNIDDNASYTVKFNDSDFSKTYTGAEFKAKRDYLEQNYAGRYDVETSVGSWDDMSQVFAPSLREQLDTFRMENRDFMNDIENRIDTNIQAARMGGGGTAAAFGRQADSLEVTDEDWTRYTELVKQEEELKRAYYTSDEYLKEQNEKAYMMAQMRDQISKDRLAFAQAHPMLATQHTATRGAEADAEMQMFETAGRIMDDAIKLQNAPSRYTPKGTGFRNMRKGAGDKASDIDLWTAGLSEITDNLGVRGVLSKVQAKLGNLNDLSEEAIESILTPAEKAVLQAWAINAQTQMARAEDLSRGYQAGQGAVESLAFMAEFALTGGVGKAASEGAETFAKWLGKKVTGSADEIVEEAAKEVAEKAGEGILKKYGKNLGLSLAEAAGRTGVMPSTFRNISEKATEINEDEDGNRTLVSMNNAFAKGLADSFIETLSEGGRVSALGSLVGDVAGKIPAYAKLTHWLSNTKAADIYNAFQSSGIMNSLRAGGWHGIFEEYLEEWYGNALRTLTHVDKDALKDFATVDNQLVTITSFLPLTIFGGTVSTAQVMKSRKQLSKASDMLKTALMDRAYSEEQANEQIDMLMGATPQQVSDYLTPIINQEGEANEEAGSKMAIVAANFTKALVKWQSYNTRYRYQEQEQRDAVRANLLQATGGKSFWMTDEDGNETVQRATNDKGEVVFVMSKPTAEDRRVSGITPDGRIVFFNDGEYQLENEKTMNDFLHGEVMAEKADKEKARMLEEKDAAIREIKAASAPGAQVTLGTVEAPIPGIIRQRLADGVIIETPEGIQHMTYEQLGNYIGINATPMTDEQIDEQQSDTMLAEDAQREAELDMEYDDVAAAEVHEEETIAEVESALKDDKPLPLDSEGEVDEEALWNEDPGRWAAWNDERKQDGGHDSFSALFHAKNALEEEVAKMEKAYKLTFVGKKRNALAQEIEAKKQRLALMEELVDEYASKVERQLMEKYAAEERAKAEQEAPAQEQAALSVSQEQMTEQQMDEMDAQYEGIYSQTRSLNERARLLQEYLDKISDGTVPVVVLTKSNYAQAMKDAGCPDYLIRQVGNAFAKNGIIEGFMAAGKAFIVAESIPTIDRGRQKYVHERQHVLVRGTDYVSRILATGVTREQLKEYVRTFSGTRFYDNYGEDVLADELLSFAMELVYTYEDFSVALQKLGLSDDLINVIKSIDDEQSRTRNGERLSQARRRRRSNYNDGAASEGGSRQDDGDLGQVSSGLLGQQDDGSLGYSQRGAGDREGGEGAAEPAVDDEINPAFVEAISTDAEDAEWSQAMDDKAFATPPAVDGIEADDVRHSIVLEDQMRESTQTYYDKHYKGGKLSKTDQKRVPLNLTHFTQELLDTANAMIEEMRQYMLPYLDMESKGKRFLPAEVYGLSTLFDNASYGKTMENTLICTRTLAYIDFVEEVKKRIGRPLTATESFLASQMLYDIAVDPQCLYCYVSLDRKAYDEFLLRYAQQRDEVIAKWNASDKSEEAKEAIYKEFLDGRKPTAQMKARFESWLLVAEGNDAITLEDLATKARRGQLRMADMPEAWAKASQKYKKLKKDKKLEYAASEEYQNALWEFLASPAGQVADAEAYAQSASWAKKEEDYRSYTGELLRCSADALKGLMGHYGLRFYSFSEYSPAFILENMQMVRDAAARGLKGFAYTKEIDFIRIFAPTGMNINCSVYGRVDSEGNVVPDTKQGADWAQVQELREQYPNVGAVFVATNDSMVEWALNQPWIDVIIPFHIVRTGADIAKFYEWTNYSSMQSDTTDEGKSGYVYPHEHLNDKETFLRITAERGWKPRFEDVKLSDGRSIVEHPNYMRLVNETRRRADETPILTPVFNLEAAKDSFDRFVEKGGYYSGYFVEDGAFEEGIETVVEDIKAGKTAKEVNYGRQDVPIDVAKIMAKRAELERKHRKNPDILAYAQESLALHEAQQAAEGEDVKFSVITPEMDAEYLAAVERGDMETAQRMVLEAAKLAMPNTKVVDENGNPKVVYHGTGNEFYVFRDTSDSNELGAGFYFSDSYDMAERYATDENLADNRFRAEALAFEIFTDEMGHSEEDYDDNEFIEDYNESYAQAVERLFGNGHVKSVFLNLENPRVLSRDSESFDPTYRYGYNHYNEGVMAKRFNDGVIDEMFSERHEGLTGTQYVAFSPSQIKSAEPVTYDDNGNVIPLSQRFNPANEDIRFSARTDEQRSQLFEAAKKQFGTTDNFKVAGYMLPDGSLLDFSEANDGGDPNQRTLDHREIEGIIMDEGREYDSRWMYLADFMNEGAIRLLPEYAGINIMKAPTKEQRQRLFDFIYKYNGEVILEIADERLNNVAYVEYGRRTSPSRIFRDIDGYFNEGIVPQQDVRFSVFEPHNATIDEIDGLFREYNMDESLTPLYDKVSALAHTMDLKIRFDYPWSAAAGSTFGDKVKFNTEFFNSLAYMPQDKAHALLHEMIHATTNYAIAARNTGALTEGMKEAVSQLEGIYGEIVNDSAFDGTYGARSVYEMVAELSNPEFRSLLKEKNLFQRIVDAIKRLLGIEVGENALDNLSATLDYMLDNYDGRVFGAVVNQYQKHQEYTRFSAVQIDPAVRQEMDTIKAKAMWDGTFMKAPNGADTNLTEDQWLMVRTKNFIEWFGDWINDPENASKIVDENGEPMVMVHGSPNKFTIFRRGKGPYGSSGRGMYFGRAPKDLASQTYGGENGYKYLVFLNVRNLFNAGQRYLDRSIITNDAGKRIPTEVMYEIIGTSSYEQFIESVTDVNAKRFESYKDIIENISKEKYQKIHDSFDGKGMFTSKQNIVKRIFRKNKSYLTLDHNFIGEIVVRDPNQIKSATETTGLFSENEDIRFSVGDFGEIYEQFRGKPKEAIAFLMEKQSGEAVGALYHPEIGEIDLVWGEAGTGKSDGYGLAKLVKFHPEVIDNLQEILSEMQIVKQSANRINLESDKYQAAVRLTWNNKAKKWLLTAFEKKNSVLDNTTDTGETSKGSKQNDTATLQDTVSDSKDSDNIENSNIEENISFSVRTKPAPQKTGRGYKVFYLKDGKLYPPMVANIGGVDTPVMVWLDADAAPIAGKSKTGRTQVKAGGKGTQGGGGTLAYRPGWHLGEIPYALQFNRKDENGEKTLFPANFVWAEVEYADDVNYQEEAMSYGMNANGKFQHSLAGLPKVPTDGSYRYRTNPNPETDPWIITGAMKVKRLLTPSEVDQMVIAAGREPQKRQEGAVTDEQINALNESLGLSVPADDTRFSAISTPTDNVVAEGMKFSIQDFARLAGNIFQDMPESFRKEAIEETFKRGWDMQSAIFQTSARLAEKENWDETDKEFAQVIRDKVQDAMDESGVVMSRPLTDKEALWMLYRSTGANTDSMLDAAKRSMVAYNLGFDKETLAREDEAKEDVRFSAVRSAKADATARLYNKSATFWWSRIKESLVDMYASVEGLVKAMEETSGKEAQGYENVIMALNQQSSKGLAAMEKYTKKYLEPMLDAISAVMKAAGKTYDDVVRYVILKHGLERNEAFAKRDAKEYWTNFFGKVDSYMKSKSHAQLVVALSEAKAKVKELEEAIMMGETGKKQALIDAQTELQIVELALRGDEKQNEADLDAKMEAIDNGADAKYKEFRKNDYSGITSMFYDQLEVNRNDFDTEEEYQEAIVAARTEKFKTLKQVEDAAAKEVEEFEDAANTDRLWKKINASTKEILRQQYEASMISKEQYDTLREMFKFYVPLRGFKDNTAEDMYTYYRKPNSTGYTKPILAAEGRRTEAESPFGWIASMASSAIASNVKNEARLALYYFVANRPDNGLATLSKTWYKYSHTDLDSGKRVFVPAYPEGLTPDMTAEEAKKAIDAWHEEMEQARKEGKAYESGQKLSLGDSVVNIEEKNRPEHAVNVKVNGKDYTIFINGNPRAAQAINGDLNVETQGDYSKVFGPLLRWMSSVNTSYNPEFWVTNMQRDFLFTIMAVSTKEDPAYRRRFAANYMKAFKVISMAAKNEEGLLGDSEIEALYKEFVDNGGVTGYTQIKDNETWEQEIANYMKSQDLEDQKMGAALKKMRDGFHAIHRFGESLEQVSRFAAFMTSRQMGRTMQESINDAKEITVNFNRKGSGKWISPEEAKTLTDRKGRPINKFQRWIAVGLTSIAPAGRRFIMFFNAAIQGLNATVKLYRKNPAKMIGAWTLGYFSLGVMQALLHSLLDDDDDYLDMPHYERRNSLMLGGNGFYFKWALPQEARMFYALGDLFVEEMLGRNPQKAFDEGSTLGQAITAVTDVLPINPFEGWRGILPSVAVPYVELVANENYKGTPIYNEQKWAGDDEADRTAKWSRAYEGTGTLYVGLSRLLNAMTGGDKHDAGFINLQPEKLEHIVQSSFGGTLRTIDKFVSTILAAVDQYLPGETDEKITMRQAPFLNRLFTINDERFKNAHVNELYGYYAAEAEHVMKLRKNYIKDKEKAKKEALDKTEEAKWVPIYKKYKKPIEKKQEQIRMAKSGPERQRLMKEQDVLKKRMIKEISEIR